MLYDKVKFKQHLSSNSILQKVLEGKCQPKETTLMKTQQIISTNYQNQKKGNTHTHTHTITTNNKITGINNHWIQFTNKKTQLTEWM